MPSFGEWAGLGMLLSCNQDTICAAQAQPDMLQRLLILHADISRRQAVFYFGWRDILGYCVIRLGPKFSCHKMGMSHQKLFAQRPRVIWVGFTLAINGCWTLIHVGTRGCKDNASPTV